MGPLSDSPFPGPPIDPVQQSTLDPLPSPLGYWIGGGIMVVAVAVAVVVFVQSVFGFVGKIDDLDRIAVPGEDTLELGEGDWVIYWEPVGDSTVVSETLGDFDITVEPVSGTEGTSDDVLVAPRDSTETYSDGSLSGYSIADFRIDEAGDYRIRVAYDSFGVEDPTANPFLRDGSIAVGRPLFSGLVTGLGIGALIGGVGFVVGLVLIIVTGVRRGKAKRARFPASGYQPAYGAPGGYPPPGGYAPPGSYPPPGASSPPGYPPQPGVGAPGSWPPPTGAPAPAAPAPGPPPSPPPSPPPPPPGAGDDRPPPASPIS